MDTTDFVYNLSFKNYFLTFLYLITLGFLMVSELLVMRISFCERKILEFTENKWAEMVAKIQDAQ